MLGRVVVGVEGKHREQLLLSALDGDLEEQSLSIVFLHLDEIISRMKWRMKRLIKRAEIGGNHYKWDVWQYQDIVWNEITKHIFYSFCGKLHILQSRYRYNTDREPAELLPWQALQHAQIWDSWDREGLRFGFLRVSTIKKCPHMLRSDHRELRNS